MRVLITGGTGLLGKTLLETAPAEWEVFATAHRRPPPEEWRDRFVPVELCDEASVRRSVEVVRPEVVIHVASIGSVDEAEREPVLVRQVNVEGAVAIGRACAAQDARLVFVSSNAVFDGRHPPYAEEAPLAAVNRYGAFKIAAETWVRSSGLSYLIIRPILMYGWPWPGGRDNVVTRWLQRFEAGQPIEAAEDMYSMPLYVGDGAQAIWAAVRGDRCGIYHIAGADRVSLADFARATARAFDVQERLVVPVSRHWFTELAPRPVDTSFVTEKMKHDLGIRPLGIVEGLALMKRLRASVS